MNIYRRNFKFAANSFEEIIVAYGRKSGKTGIIIKGNILSDEVIHISFIGLDFVNGFQIAPFCVLPMTEPYIGGDILQDRIMYGRLPQFQENSSPLKPIVCEIFNDLTTIRFAFENPLRIIEFHGEFISEVD